MKIIPFIIIAPIFDATVSRAEENLAPADSSQQIQTEAERLESSRPSGVKPDSLPAKALGSDTKQDSVQSRASAEPARQSVGDQAVEAAQRGMGRSWSDWIISKDSLAQWIMALAAIIATGISYWAVSLLRDTLNATRDAVNESSRAAAAAEKSVSVAQDAAQRQLRAYVQINKTSIDWKRKNASVEIRNTGQTPAYQLTHWMCTGYGPQNRDAFEQLEGQQPGTLGAQGIMTMETRFSASAPISQIRRRQGLTAFVWGRIDYVDAFQVKRWTSYRLRLSADPAVDRFTPCKEGNDAN